MHPLRPRYGRKAAAIVSSALLSIGLTAVAEAAEPAWIKLQNSRFGVISQLDEDDTRKWAVEFDQFIDALQQLYAYEGDLGLPPLTIVLFDQARAFAPYRIQTESGQTKVAGFFGNMGTWSVIGLPGRQSSVDTRRVIYHEAVHWFASGDDVASPTWFEEGLAEVFSTFEIVNGKGRWGNVVQNNVDYLGAYGLLPLDQFLRMSKDEALHGSPKYYPEAWAFVHYLVFGNNGAERTKLGDFLREARAGDLDTAFTSAFGKTYDEMTKALRGYLQRGRYVMAEIPVRDRGGEMIVGPASPAQVEFALARVAFAGGNDALARKHIDAVLALAPKSAPLHELLALLAARAEDGPALEIALDQAIALGSEDSTIYAMKGFDLIDDNRNENAAAGDALPAAIARSAADMFGRSIELRPRNLNAYGGLVFALLNVDEFTDKDAAALALGRRAYPTEGIVLVGQAALERQHGNVTEAVRLLRSARSDAFTLESRQRPMVAGLHDTWLLEWVSDQLNVLAPAERFEEAHALLDAQLADEALTGRPRTAIASMKADLTGYQRIQTALAAGRAGNTDEARAALAALANDPDVTERTRRDAQRILDRLPK